MNIYIANGLTHVPRERFSSYVSFIHKLADGMKEHMVKYALVNSDPQLSERPYSERASLCYLWDRKMVENADLLIAEASFPSIGLGIELQIAETKKIPIILIFRDYNENKASPVKYQNPDSSVHDLQIGEGFVSLMALGLSNIYKVIRYNDEKECIDNIHEILESAFRKG